MSRPRILLTRSEEGNRAWADELRRLGAEPVGLACLEVAEVDEPDLPGRLHRALARAHWLALASPRAVEATRRLLDRATPGQRWGPAAPSTSFSDLSIAAVGPATAEACRRLLGRCDLRADPPTGRGLAECLRRRLEARGEAGDAGTGKTVVTAAARHGRQDLEEVLGGTGTRVERLVVYEMRPVEEPAQADLDFDRIDGVFFASPSAVEGFLRRVRAIEPGLGRTAFVAIGPTTAAASRAHGLPVQGVAEEPSLPGLWRAFNPNPHTRDSRIPSGPGQLARPVNR